MRGCLLSVLVLCNLFCFAQPKANFTPSVIAGCSPLVVQFTDSSTGLPQNWEWDFGNGNKSTNKNPGAIYSTPGIYTVRLTVTNANGTDSIAKVGLITVYDKPLVNFDVDTTNGCIPLAVHFTDKSTDKLGAITKWTWDFGDGQSDSVQNPLHKYIAVGSFSVTLKVTDPGGCSNFLQKQAVVNTDGVFNPSFDYSYTNSCTAPTLVTFNNNTAAVNTVNYQWYFGDGGASSSASPLYTYKAKGIYSVQLIAITKGGCRDTVTKSISIGTVTSDFILSSSSCEKSPAFFTDNSLPKPISATWSFGDGFSASGENVLHIFGAAGSYPVKLVTNFGACKDSVTKYFKVTGKPTASFTSTGNRNSCALPGNVQFQNTSVDGIIISWNFGDFQTSNQHNPLHVYKYPGSYTVMEIAQNTAGCSDTLYAKNYVRLGPPKIDSIANLPFKGCVPDVVNFKAAVSSGETVAKYIWGFGDGTAVSNTKSPTHTYTALGSYNVTLKVVTVTGCTDSATFTQAVKIGNKPTANFTASPLSNCADSLVNFTDKSAGNIDAWFWNFGDGATSNVSNPTHIYADTGYFNVTLIVTNSGCSDTLKQNKFIAIKPPYAIFSVKYLCKQSLSVAFSDYSIGASTWNWDFGDGQTSKLQNPPYTYKKSGTYNVKLTVTNGTCVDTTVIPVTVVGQIPYFTYSLPKDSICRYDTVQFTAKNYDSIGNIDLFFWNFGDGGTTAFNINTPSATHKYRFPFTYTPYLVLYLNNGCKDTIKMPGFSLKVFGPTASFSNTNTTCINTTVTFSDSSVTDGLHPLNKWYWDFGDGDTATFNAPPFTHKYSSAGTFKAKLKVFDSYGCYDTAMKYNLFTPKPVANFSVLDTIKCLGSGFNFADSSTGVFLSYQWDFGDGNTSTKSSPQHQYLNKGVYSVALNITDQYGCSDSLKKANFLRIANPKASFTVVDTFGLCPPLKVMPINTSLDYNFLTWDFGDVNTSNVLDPVHYYSNAGTYKLQLVAQGHGGCNDTASKTIVVKGPSGSIKYSPLVLCNNEKATFVVTGNNIAKCVWDFADGNTDSSNILTRSHAYSAPGFYLPKVLVTDSAGCNVTLVNTLDTLRVIGITNGFTATPNPGCDSALVSFNNNSIVINDSLSSILWNFGDGSVSTQSAPAHYYYSTGIKTVRVNITTKFGCAIADSLPVNVTIHQSPVLKATIPAQVCVNATANFSAFNNNLPPSAIRWLWKFGTNDSSTQQNPAYIYTQTGHFNITLSATNEFGCTDTATGTTIVSQVPKLHISTGIDTPVCRGQNIVLTVIGADSYLWAANPTLSCFTCDTVTATPIANTWYYVTGTDVGGCYAKDSIYLPIVAPFKMAVPQVYKICTGQSVTLSAAGASTYIWQPSTGLSNANIANPVASPLVSTTYTLIGYDAKKCVADTFFVAVNVGANPSVKLKDTSVTILAGSNYLPASTTSPDVIKWQWLPLAGVSCGTCAQPTLTPAQTTRYEERVFNQFGCTSSDFVTVHVLCNSQNIFIPNTFSPNGDGTNDYFFPRGVGLYSIKNMQVFNRWGQLVFERRNVAVNNPSTGWDGTINGQPAPADVYIYVIEVYCTNSTIIPMKGSITLIR